MSITASYFFVWCCAIMAALLAGLFSHWVHSEFRPYPDKLLDGTSTSDALLNEFMSPEHRVFGAYDDGGWWRFDSWRNCGIHAGPYVFCAVTTGLWYWGDREAAIEQVCSAAAGIGISPLFCP